VRTVVAFTSMHHLPEHTVFASTEQTI
jgi:hypothetical protein